MNINNDADILKHTRREALPTGGVKLMIPGNLTPSGEPFAAVVKNENTGALVEWCSMVRGLFNDERENREGTKARGKADARAPANGGEGSSVQQHGGSRVAADAFVPTTEEEMERFLAHSINVCEQEIAARETERDVIEARLEALYVQAFRLKNAYKAYNANAARVDDGDEGSTTKASTPEVRDEVGD